MKLFYKLIISMQVQINQRHNLYVINKRIAFGNIFVYGMLFTVSTRLTMFNFYTDKMNYIIENKFTKMHLLCTRRVQTKMKALQSEHYRQILIAALCQVRKIDNSYIQKCSIWGSNSKQNNIVSLFSTRVQYLKYTNSPGLKQHYYRSHNVNTV